MPTIPDDLREYLSTPSNLNLRFEEKAVEIQEVTLYDPSELIVKTFDVDTADFYLNGELDEDPKLRYEFEGIDLVKSCDAYDPKGILIWFPQLNAYGSWDCDHRRIILYPNESWTDIIQKPTWYFNGQWYPEKVEHKDLRPWENETSV